MKNFTPELIAKVKAAKSADELLTFAKENNVELTETEAKTYFDQLSANGAVSDDELDVIAGGLSCPSDDEKDEDENELSGTFKCTFCGGLITLGRSVCPWCNKPFSGGRFI